MKPVALILLLAAVGTAVQTPALPGRREWIGPALGHRVIRISDDPGRSTVYSHDPRSPREVPNATGLINLEIARQK